MERRTEGDRSRKRAVEGDFYDEAAMDEMFASPGGQKPPPRKKHGHQEPIPSLDALVDQIMEEEAAFAVEKVALYAQDCGDVDSDSVRECMRLTNIFLNRFPLATGS